MASFNKVFLVGNIVETPELSKTALGIPVTRFRIAVCRRFGKENRQEADFINIVARRNTAEFITQYFTKGKPILVCGSFRSRNRTDQNGQKRYTVEVVADEVSFIGRKDDTPKDASVACDSVPLAELPITDGLPF